MTIVELMQELAALYPRSFGNQASLEAWTRQYRAALPEGINLGEAWASCMAGWTYQSFPKPADIKRHYPREARESGGGINMKAQNDHVAANIRELVASAVANAEQRSGQRSWWFTNMAQKHCEDYLRRQWLHDHGHIREQSFARARWTLTDDEIEGALRLTARKPMKPVKGFAQPSRTTPRSSASREKLRKMSNEFRERAFDISSDAETIAHQTEEFHTKELLNSPAQGPQNEENFF